MIYIERRPHPALEPYIRTFWYTRTVDVEHGLERVLPSGRMQLVISLARDYLTDCSALAASGSEVLATKHSAAALVTGMRSRYDVIDRFDMAELIGVIFHPGGTVRLFPARADALAGVDTALADVWGRGAEVLRERMRDARDIGTKFDLLEGELLQRLRVGAVREQPTAVSLALAALHDAERHTSVREIGSTTGLSTRRLSEIFREQVGVSPKVYQRIVRFQRAVQQMHRGADVRWMDLALECGYYDQSHFVNDFREFSGINPTTYSALPRVWSNHLPFE